MAHWKTTDDKLGPERDGASLEPLKDGSALLAGGCIDYQPIATAERFDPKIDRFVPTGSMKQARCRHGSVRLRDGRVLIVGGSSGKKPIVSGDSPVATVEIYDPTTGAFTEVTPMHNARMPLHCMRLSDGNVLVSGNASLDGAGQRDSEIFDVARGEWRAGPMLDEWRDRPAVARAEEGSALVAGGRRWGGGGKWRFGDVTGPNAVDLDTGLRFDGAGAPRSFGSMKPGVAAAAAPLPANEFVVAGGETKAADSKPTSAAFRVDAAGAVRRVGSLTRPRAQHTLTSLRDGRVLAFGGHTRDESSTKTAELYEPARDEFVPAPPAPHARVRHQAVLLADGRILVIGGESSGASALPAWVADVDLFIP